MLTYPEALKRILDAIEPLPAENIAVPDAYGRVLARDIVSTQNLPPFDNSAVDGYAIRAEDAEYIKKGNRSLIPVSQSIAAGDDRLPVPLTLGAAAEIFTGAIVPANTGSIIMVEDSELLSGGMVYLHDAGSAKHIRRAGSDVKVGDTALAAGDVDNAGGIGLLSSLGVRNVSVHALPRVGILSTGNELVPVTTTTLEPGKIRDSNGPALEAAVNAAGGIVHARLHAPDDKDALRNALLSLSACDVVLTSGGVSVGGADFVKEIIEEVGTLDFWRVAIKPGKPLAFGKVGDALFFGLPGNPVSSLVTFELFVRPVLQRLAGHRDVLRPQITATHEELLPHEPGRREFVRARVTYRDGAAFATHTGAQGSHRLSTMVGANALLIAHEDHEDYAAGDVLPAFLLF